MRVGVIGAGAVGGTIAALLDRAGHEVAVTARGAHLAAIREGGIRLSGGWGSHTAGVAAAELLEARFDLVVLTTKAQDAVAALHDNAAAIAGTPLLVVQNGLDGIETAERESAASSVAGGLAMFAASYLSPGEVTITTPAVTYLGGTGADSIAARIGGAVPVEVVEDFAGSLWTKLFVNQLNALPAITGLSVQEVVGTPGLLRVLTASMRENVRVAHANGVRYGSLSGLDDRRLRLFAAAPLGLATALPRRMGRRMGDVPNPGSTLQSIRRGQKTEVDYLNGAVVARAGSVPVPVNRALVALVHEVEAAGRFIPPGEVVARVTAADRPADSRSRG